MSPSPAFRQSARVMSVPRRVFAAWLGALTASLALGACATHPAPVSAADTIALAARPNGIAVRAADGALFITDDRSGAILSSPDGRHFAPYATVPAPAGQPNSLSQPIFATSTDGAPLLVGRFGFGSAGAIFEIGPHGEALPLAGLDPSRRRLGLAALGAGRALSSWFVENGPASVRGGLSLVSFDPASGQARERVLIDELRKPVGVAVVGDDVYVSDQAQNALFRASLKNLLASEMPVAPGAPFASIAAPDLLAADARGRLYTKCGATGLCMIAPDGTVHPLVEDLHGPRGVAVDARRRLLYVIERASAKTGGTDDIRRLALP